MKGKRNTLVALTILLVLTCAAAVVAQAPPKPGPEHQKLAYFAGTWNIESDMKPSSFGPGVKFTTTETCEWFPGGLALVCRTEGKMPEGAMKSLSIMSYDPAEKTYVYFETSNMGDNIYARGTVAGDTWTWINESKMNGAPVHTRYTLKQLSADSATFKIEMGFGEKPMNMFMEGKQTRVK